MTNNDKERSGGLISILSVYFIWGLLPAYWKLMRHIDPVLILAHRVIWAFALLVVAIIGLKKSRHFKGILKIKSNMLFFALAGLSVFFQWLFYILSVVTDHILEVSLGYYIYPIIVVVFSRIFFREKLNRFTLTAFFLAFAGVLILIVAYHTVPLYGLGLAFSFAFYSSIKKKLAVDSLISTFFEILFLLPFALGYALFGLISDAGGTPGTTYSAASLLLLIGGGVFTSVTLLLFSSGARKISFTTVGFLQYISPTMALILAVSVYKENFGTGQWIAFGCVWLGILVYSIPSVKSVLSRKKILSEAAV